MVNIKDSIIQETFELYEGEETDYGKDGWEITKKLFEYGSRMVLTKNNPEADKGRKFTESKIVHCFLNAQGYSTSYRTIVDIPVNREMMFHLQNFIGNLIKIKNKNTIDQEIVRDATIIFEDLLNKIQNSPVEFV